MGSLIAQVYVERSGDALAGYVLSGSAGLTEVVPEFATMLHEALNAGMRDEPVDSFGEFGANGDARSRFDWLSRDAEEVDKYVADPWCGDDAPLTYGFVAAMLEPVATSMEPEMLAACSEAPPGPLDHGRGRPGIERRVQARSEQRLRDAGLAVTARYYVDACDELLNEINRDEVHADVVAWLNRVLPAR